MSVLGRLSMMKKLLIGPLVVIFFLLMMAFQSYRGLSDQQEALTTIYKVKYANYQEASGIWQEVAGVNANVNKLMNWINSNTNKDRVEELGQAQVAVLDKNVESLNRFAKKPDLTEEGKKLTETAVGGVKAYRKAVADAIDISVADVNAATVMVSSVVEENYQRVHKTLQGLLDLQNRASQEQYQASLNGYKRTLLIFMTVLLAAILFSVGINVALARIISKPINQANETIQQIARGDLTREIHLDSRDEIGELVGAIDAMRRKFGEAVGQSVAMSQSLSGAASQQAAALEETSSSLEEMASMTKQNAGHADQANQLIAVTHGLMGKANDSMGDLTTSMKEIAQASEQTQKIVKTIDEIAFQTNLLALNAAVEAARAGEAGAGFAVVADEVRNLAMRAADAARNTSGLIEDIVKKIQGGVSVVTATNRNFNEVSTNSGKVRELVEEIAAASKEQSQGIEQINQSVAEMNKVTQQNASVAEDLAAVMATFKTGTGGREPDAGSPRHRAPAQQQEPVAAGLPARASAREISPGEVLPLEEGDF
ncbi:MAG: methyl-accepting chemotaxis protein [Desulfobacterota bacterium]|jgi:methyl-accepting chemotaxis protein|nr:methyl-accepting chemotaxis protein [Thermodesulfobacteriota bacterium]